MSYDKIEQFAQNLVSTMTQTDVSQFHRHAFIAKFSHPDFNTYSSFVELTDLVEFYVSVKAVEIMEATSVAA